MKGREFLKTSSVAGTAALSGWAIPEALAQPDQRQTLIGRRLPNLMYMTVHQDMVTREKTLEQFSNSEDWKKLRSAPAFVDTVSATTIVFLRPAAYSQI